MATVAKGTMCRATISQMIPTQRLPLSLTPLDAALAALLRAIEPVAPVVLPLADALGTVAADMPPLRAHPSRDVAVSDGWALRAAESLVGASSYSPLPLSASPVWVEAGEAMPAGCDCVIDSDPLDQTGPMVQALAEATPGQGFRRAGSEILEASTAIAPGRRIRPLDLLIARAGGLAELHVRRPRLRMVNIPATSGTAVTARLIAESAQAAGAAVVSIDAAGRDAASVAAAAATDACDMLVTTGGSGVGGNDAVVAALARRGEVLAHGIALQPGCTAAVGRSSGDRAAGRAGSGAGGVVDAGASGCLLLPRSPAAAAGHPAACAQDCLEAWVSPNSCCCNGSRAGGCRWRSATFRSTRSPAPTHGWRYPAGPKAMLRVRRSMPICCGTDIGFMVPA